MKYSLLLLLYLHALSILAQDSFETGYIISDQGERREVEIQNKDWRYNPEYITVREDGRTEKVATATLSAFGISGKARFEAFTLLAETSSNTIGNLLSAPAQLEEQRLLLRIEVKGPATLYSYRKQQVTKYFLRPENEVSPVQLVNTHWRDQQGNVAQSDQYVSQLNNALRCEGDAPASRNTDYSLRVLRKIVTEYNECQGAESMVYLNNAARGKRLFVKIAPGLYFTRFAMQSNSNGRVLVETDARTLFRPGIEFDYRPPFGNNRLGLLFSPSYYSYEGAGDYSEVFAPTQATVDYSVIDLPIGVKYQFSHRERFSFYATALIGYGIILSGEVAPNQGRPIETGGSFSLNGGVGAQFASFGLEARYQRDSDFLPAGGFASNTDGVRLMVYYSF